MDFVQESEFLECQRRCCGFEERIVNKAWLSRVYKKDETLLAMHGDWWVINSPPVLLVEIMSIRV